MTSPVTRVFLCTNRRVTPLSCGTRADTHQAAIHLRKAITAAGSDQPVQVIESRCLGRCPHGPVLVTLPDRVFYGWRDATDLEDIAQHHITDGDPVTRLTLQAGRRPQEPTS